MKILFVQLPLMDHGYNYIMGNVPYAPATLTAFIKRNGLPADCDILPFVIANFGSDRTIASYIVNSRPDCVCFTAYLWNIERGLDLAAIIREQLPGTAIIFGGPEIHAESWVLSRHWRQVDMFFCGEGEWFFRRFLDRRSMTAHSAAINGNTLIIQPDTEPVPPSQIVEPFTAGFLDAMIDGSTFLELTRGCPYRCAYCYYSKNCATVRELDFELLLTAIRKKSPQKLSEIYILSPTFNTGSDFEKKLERLAAANTVVRLHTEMRAAGIDTKRAALLYQAGFRSLEVGLQTLTTAARARIGRRGAPRAELAGMQALTKAGIELKIGIIPGLPGDTLADFQRTVETLVDDGFAGDIELYPLMMLPGTRIREMAQTENVAYQTKPPYFFLSGWDFTPDDMQAIITGHEEATGYTHSVKRLPDFIRTGSGLFTQGVRFDGSDPRCWDGSRYRDLVETAVFSFHVTGSIIPAMVPDGIRALLGALPLDHQLYNLIVHADVILPEERIATALQSLDRDGLLRRLHVFDEWRDGLPVRCYQIFESVSLFKKAVTLYRIIEPIFRITDTNARRFINLSSAPLYNVLVSAGDYTPVREFLINAYDEYPEQIAFEDEREQEDFFSAVGHEFLRWPFSLKTVVA